MIIVYNVTILFYYMKKLSAMLLTINIISLDDKADVKKIVLIFTIGNLECTRIQLIRSRYIYLVLKVSLKPY